MQILIRQANKSVLIKKKKLYKKFFRNNKIDLNIDLKIGMIKILNLWAHKIKLATGFLKLHQCRYDPAVIVVI